MSFYTPEALRRFRKQQAAGAAQPALPLSLAARVPADVPVEDAAITVWNGERFVAYDRWLATTPIDTDPAPVPKYPVATECLAATCGETRIWLVEDAERWRMLIGKREPANRRADFASPYLEHAIRTAEQWYGAPAAGWRRETKAYDKSEDRVEDGCTLLPDVQR